MSLITPQALSHLVIQASDVAKSAAWYKKVFGFDIVMDNSKAETGARAMGVIGGVALEILKAGGAGKTEASADITAGGPGYTLVSFSVADIDKTLEALRAEGLAGPEPATAVAGMKYAFLRDPDGILIEIIQLPNGAKALAEVVENFRQPVAAK